MEWLARGIGLFYLLGGIFGLHAARMNGLMDKVLAGITLKPTPANEKLRAAGLWTGSALTLLSGLALLLLSPWAVWLFVANLVWQAIYLALASIYLKPEDAADADGRRKTINAAILWTGATIAVLIWSHNGLLTGPG